MAGDYSAYDFQEDDPYLLPGSTCLINLLGISNTSSLNQAEADITQVTLAELVRTPVKGSFDLTHLQEIHYRIFQDVYPFAGKLRTVDILKGGKLFLPFTLIETKANELFNELANENYLQGLELKSFSERAELATTWEISIKFMPFVKAMAVLSGFLSTNWPNKMTFTLNGRPYRVRLWRGRAEKLA